MGGTEPVGRGWGLHQAGTRLSATSLWLLVAERPARAAGITAGLTLICLLVATGGVQTRGANPPAALTIKPVPTGELGIGRNRALVAIRDLRPGRHDRRAYGATTVTNLTGKPMRVHARLVSSGHDLDRLVQAGIVLGKRPMGAGLLAGLRRWTTGDFVLAPGHGEKLRVMAWLPEDTDAKYKGLSASFRLELRARPAVYG